MVLICFWETLYLHICFICPEGKVQYECIYRLNLLETEVKTTSREMIIQRLIKTKIKDRSSTWGGVGGSVPARFWSSHGLHSEIWTRLNLHRFGINTMERLDKCPCWLCRVFMTIQSEKDWTNTDLLGRVCQETSSSLWGETRSQSLENIWKNDSEADFCLWQIYALYCKKIFNLKVLFLLK